MGLIDVILLAILALGFISGLQKGFITSILACLAMLGAWFAARAFYPELAGQITGSNLESWLIETKSLSAEASVSIFNTLSFSVIFILGYALLLLIVNLINNVFRMPKLRGVDGLLGGVLGICRAAVILLVIIAALKLVFEPIDPELIPSVIAESTFAKRIADINILDFI